MFPRIRFENFKSLKEVLEFVGKSLSTNPELSAESLEIFSDKVHGIDMGLA